jgi:hypothetical protein
VPKEKLPPDTIHDAAERAVIDLLYALAELDSTESEPQIQMARARHQIKRAISELAVYARRLSATGPKH